MDISVFWNFADGRLAIEILLILYYLTVLIVFTTSRKRMFRSPFYVVYIVTGFLDVMVAVATIYIRFDFTNKLGSEYEIFIRLAASLTGSNYFTHMVGHMLTAIIQWSAVCLPHHFKSLWSNRNMAVILILDVAICFASCYGLYFNPFTYETVNGREERRGRKDPDVVPIARWFSCGLGVVSVLVSMSCLLRTMWVLRKLSLGERQARIREESILIYIVVNVLAVGLECAYELMFTLHVSTGEAFQAFLAQFFSYYFFVMMIMNSFTILLMSASSRKEVVRRCIFCMKNREETTITGEGTSGNPRVVRINPSNTFSVTPRGSRRTQ